jgi:Ca-activated chloride channel family protein
MRGTFFSVFFLATWLFGLVTIPVVGQVSATKEESSAPLTRILFLFDASQSMYARWQSDQKINIAREILANVLDTLSRMDNVEVALRVYGHQHLYPPQICDDTRLEVPFGKNNFRKIIDRLKSLKPRGTSPIAFSLEQSASDFPKCDDCRNIIVLITDGIEECDGDPCEVSLYLQKQGVILKPFVIGIGRDFEEAFNCVGTYFDASSELQFGQALNAVISRALNPTTIQVNLIDSYGRPTETNINMSFYDHVSGKLKYNFIHTMNVMGLPDTMIVDPLVTYDLVVHTVPPVRADSIFITPGKHNIIPVNAPQGMLNLTTETQGNLARGLQCIIRRDGSYKTINVQEFGKIQKYLTGIYDLEVLSLPRMIIEDVKIKQNHTTRVAIPLPGIAVIQKNAKGYGGIYLEKDGRLEWVYSFREDQSQQESLILMPGVYHVIFRSKYVDRAMYTIDKKFEVVSGHTENVKLF